MNYSNEITQVKQLNQYIEKMLLNNELSNDISSGKHLSVSNNKLLSKKAKRYSKHSIK